MNRRLAIRAAKLGPKPTLDFGAMSENPALLESQRPGKTREL
jgi:hypothetical protein